MQIANPYHAGELALQEETAERGSAIRNGRAIADSIMPGAQKFVNQRSMVVLGSPSREGQVWCSLLTGGPGFVTAPDQRRVAFELSEAGSHGADPLWENLVHREQIGMLAIDLATRRRLRINGTLGRAGSNRYELDVSEAYPNCPQYIQRRNVATRASDAANAGDRRVREGATIPDEHVRLIRSADTFFVASAHPERGADASHRGGATGFVRVIDRSRLRIPDYPGNGMFNTLGNFRVNPRAGLLFPDFRRGRTLQLTGSAAIEFNARDDPTHSAGGTGRYWDFVIDRWIDAPMQYPLQVELIDAWPKNPEPARGTEGRDAIRAARAARVEVSR